MDRIIFPEPICVIDYRREGHRYYFSFDDESLPQAIAQVNAYVTDPEFDFDQEDATAIITVMRQLCKKGLENG